jgi:hypothetical protein
MRRLGMPVSDTTILRSLKEHARVRSDNGAVHVAGIDDWAWRKGANYGTIIVDLERALRPSSTGSLPLTLLKPTSANG